MTQIPGNGSGQPQGLQRIEVVSDAEEAAAKRQEREGLTLAELDESNEKRLADLMSGALGMKVNIQPGMFENLRTLTLLEAITEHLGIAESAGKKYAVKAAGILDTFEQSVRMAVIKSGGGQTIDLSEARSLQGQVQKNREQRRAEQREKPEGGA
jgi:hypothetical protein